LPLIIFMIVSPLLAHRWHAGDIGGDRHRCGLGDLIEHHHVHGHGDQGRLAGRHPARQRRDDRRLRGAGNIQNLDLRDSGNDQVLDKSAITN
jgi:hypothetical protein